MRQLHLFINGWVQSCLSSSSKPPTPDCPVPVRPQSDRPGLVDSAGLTSFLSTTTAENSGLVTPDRSSVTCCRHQKTWVYTQENSLLCRWL